MALVLSFIHQGFQYYHETQDPRTTELLVVNPPWLPVALVGGYLYFVLSLGPKLMKDRKPFNLRTLLLVYNVLQVAANAYLSCYGTYLLLSKGWSWSCQPFDKSTSELAMTEVQLSYYYVLLKLADLIDTVFFVLRKKQSHVSFLHVYHHAVMVLVPFIFMRNYPTGHCSLLGLLNTYVHAAMYFYFFMTVYRPELVKDVRWKKYLTMMQMGQFVILAVYFGQPALRGLDCGIPVYWFWLGMGQAVFMLAMFADFYKKAYLQRKIK
uniref:Elongation of very long chain fatty acids protein n=3 Tax=Culex pipiens TaxID=7175 RepID=A0A8D8ABM4_CULPI